MRVMGFLDRVKKLLGVDSAEDDDEETSTAQGESSASARGAGNAELEDRRAAAARSRGGRGGRGGAQGRERPPLAEAPPPSQSVEDALAAREAGNMAEARRILADIDRGGGLRTVLRAAAALEAGDERELASLLPGVAAEEPRWRLLLQIAAALDDAARAAALVERASQAGAPAWAVAWSRALSTDATIRREGLVDLLFTDAPLARTVAARDLGAEGVVADPDAAARYAAFVHGRDSIRRFGAGKVADLADRARKLGGL